MSCIIKLLKINKISELARMYVSLRWAVTFSLQNKAEKKMASKKKGLSLEEKRQRMMEIFYESKDVFLLKDIEKIAPKSKGVNSYQKSIYVLLIVYLTIRHYKHVCQRCPDKPG